jgi:glyoxylase-like metal-dependent hydrolase (beta-lactamase superfamily II)
VSAEIRHVALCDNVGTFPEELDSAFPAAGLTGPWSLHVHCHLLFVDHRIVLVDTGAGPPWSPAASWFTRPGRLLAALAGDGLTPGDVTDVVLTHLHSDHVGWTVHGDPARPEPTFPNARHLVQRAELDRLTSGTPAQNALYGTHVGPLRDAGLVDVVDGFARPLPRLELRPSPGHTAGHQSLAVDLGDETLLVSGDAFVHPTQVTSPEIAYTYEDDPAVAAATRREVLAAAGQRRTLLAPAHFESTVGLLEFLPSGNATLAPRRTCTERQEQPRRADL